MSKYNQSCDQAVHSLAHFLFLLGVTVLFLDLDRFLLRLLFWGRHAPALFPFLPPRRLLLCLLGRLFLWRLGRLLGEHPLDLERLPFLFPRLRRLRRLLERLVEHPDELLRLFCLDLLAFLLVPHAIFWYLYLSFGDKLHHALPPSTAILVTLQSLCWTRKSLRKFKKGFLVLTPFLYRLLFTPQFSFPPSDLLLCVFSGAWYSISSNSISSAISLLEFTQFTQMSKLSLSFISRSP